MPGVVRKACEGIRGDGQHTRSYRHMRGRDAHEINQQRNGKDRSAATEEPELYTDQDAQDCTKTVLDCSKIIHARRIHPPALATCRAAEFRGCLLILP
nr:hypothetical protein [Palleronia aestuarii]